MNTQVASTRDGFASEPLSFNVIRHQAQALGQPCRNFGTRFRDEKLVKSKNSFWDNYFHII